MLVVANKGPKNGMSFAGAGGGAGQSEGQEGVHLLSIAPQSEEVGQLETNRAKVLKGMQVHTNPLVICA